VIQNRTVLISGSSGLIGQSLTDELRRRGTEVRRLVRRSARYADEFEWDPYSARIDDMAMTGVDVVVNLSGANIGEKRWTKDRKQVLYDSRITTTRFLAETMAQMSDPPSTLVSQSAVGIYGDRGDDILTERSDLGPADDFLASLTLDWEAAAEPARGAGVRVVHPRTGLVLAQDAPLLDRLVPIFRIGIGGPLGTGDQWWSWVDVNDVIGSTLHMIESDFTGPFNVSAPEPARQSDFAETLASVLRRPSVVPIPSFALKMALGPEKAGEIGLTSTRALPERLLGTGYEFTETNLERSLRRAIGSHHGADQHFATS
jgi:uncharacterized protein (TIGR01777 family)